MIVNKRVTRKAVKTDLAVLSFFRKGRRQRARLEREQRRRMWRAYLYGSAEM